MDEDENISRRSITTNKYKAQNVKHFNVYNCIHVYMYHTDANFKILQDNRILHLFVLDISSNRNVVLRKPSS